MSSPESSAPAPKRIRLIGSALASAVRLWLRSQVERVEDLQVQIEAGDRQILTGHLPAVTIAARGAVYQGLHLTEADLQGTNIRVNLGQVLRGQPLRLLAIVPVTGAVRLSQADLNASLQNPLLANAVTEFLLALLRSGSADLLDAPADRALNLQDLRVRLETAQVVLSANLVSASGNPTPIAIRTGLRIADGHTLQLDRPQWLPHAQAKRGLPLSDLDGYAVDLGADVDIQTVAIEPEQLVCRGRINVIPAATPAAAAAAASQSSTPAEP